MADYDDYEEVTVRADIYAKIEARAEKLGMDINDYIDQALEYALLAEDVSEEYKNGGNDDRSIA